MSEVITSDVYHSINMTNMTKSSSKLTLLRKLRKTKVDDTCSISSKDSASSTRSSFFGSLPRSLPSHLVDTTITDNVDNGSLRDSRRGSRISHIDSISRRLSNISNLSVSSRVSRSSARSSIASLFNIKEKEIVEEKPVKKSAVLLSFLPPALVAFHKDLLAWTKCVKAQEEFFKSEEIETPTVETCRVKLVKCFTVDASLDGHELAYSANVSLNTLVDWKYQVSYAAKSNMVIVRYLPKVERKRGVPVVNVVGITKVT